MKEYEDHGLTGWKKVSNFLLDSDPRTLFFVMKQFKLLLQPNKSKVKRKRSAINPF